MNELFANIGLYVESVMIIFLHIYDWHRANSSTTFIVIFEKLIQGRPTILIYEQETTPNIFKK